MKHKKSFWKKNTNKIPYWLMWLSVPACFIISVLALLRTPSWLSIFEFDQNTNNIAGTIAGFSAPIFGFLSAVLVYYSFRQQYKANKQQRKIINTELKRNNMLKEYEQIVSLIEVYRKEIDSLEYNNHQNIEVLELYVESITKVNVHFLDYATKRIALTLGIFRTILDKIDTYGNYINEELPELMKAKKLDVQSLKDRMNIEFTRIENPLSTLANENNYNLQLEKFTDVLRKGYQRGSDGSVLNPDIKPAQGIRFQNDFRTIYNESTKIYSICELIPYYKFE